MTNLARDLLLVAVALSAGFALRGCAMTPVTPAVAATPTVDPADPVTTSDSETASADAVVQSVHTFRVRLKGIEKELPDIRHAVEDIVFSLAMTIAFVAFAWDFLKRQLQRHNNKDQNPKSPTLDDHL